MVKEINTIWCLETECKERSAAFNNYLLLTFAAYYDAEYTVNTKTPQLLAETHNDSQLYYPDLLFKLASLRYEISRS